MKLDRAYCLGPLFYRSQAVLLIVIGTAVSVFVHFKSGTDLAALSVLFLPAYVASALLIWIAAAVKNRSPNLSSWTAFAIAIPAGPAAHGLIGLTLLSVLWATSPKNAPLTEVDMSNLRFGLVELAIFAPLLWVSVKIHKRLKRQ